MIRSVNATPTDAVAAPKSNTSPPFRLYAAIFALFIAVRFGDLLVRDMEWTVWVNQSEAAWYLSMVVAGLLSALTAQYLKTRVAHLLAWLMCGFVGASCTLLTSSSVGMLVGFAVGAILVLRESVYSRYLKVAEAFPWIGSCVRGLRRFAIHVVQLFYIPVCSGLLAGALVVLGFLVSGQRSLKLELAMVGLAAALGFVFFVASMCRVWKSRERGGRRWPRWYEWSWSVPLFFCSVIVGLILSLMADSQTRTARLGPGVRTHPGGIVTAFFSLCPELISSQQIMNSPRLQQVLQGLAPLETATEGIHTGFVYLGPQSEDADLNVVTGFPLLHTIVIETNSGVTDSCLAKLSSRHLVNLHVQRGTKITDKGIAGIDKSHLQMLTLEGESFSDDALIGIDKAIRLSHLTLAGTSVTSEGLSRLSASTPLYHLDLRDTQIDDDVFETLARIPTLTSVQLGGTQITGRGIAQLTTSRIRYLSLENTQFDEQHLLELLPSGEHDKSLEIGGLGLRGVPISKAGIKTISQIKGIGGLDLRGSEIDRESMQLLQKLPLSSLDIDGACVAPELLELVNWATTLRLDYDAETMPATEIRQHCERAVKSAPSGNVVVTIRNLELTEGNVKEILICFRVAAPGLWEFRLEDAIDSDLEIKRNYYNKIQFVSEFSDWNAELNETAGDK